MFSGIVSDHWSQSTFHSVSDTMQGVIRKLHIYLDCEVSLEGIEAFIWDEEGNIVSNLRKCSTDSGRWDWVSADDTVFAIICDDHMGRHLRFFSEDVEKEDDPPASEGMEWDDFVDESSPDSDAEGGPTMVSVLVGDDCSCIVMMLGDGDPKDLAMEISLSFDKEDAPEIGCVCRLSDAAVLMTGKRINRRCMRWSDEQGARSFDHMFSESVGRMKREDAEET